jgi:pimeloyl-ACP methyl ester carboxylesterase
MPIVAANGIDLCYDEVGDAKAQVILLIMGLGTQMIAWPDAFCFALAQRGFRVVRFDNRDIGLSTKIENAAPVDLIAAFASAMAGESVEAPYALDDMAADTVGLMDALRISRAHMVGASMGGMIAQIVAARYADRARSLTSIMSSSGAPACRRAGPRQFQHCFRLVHHLVIAKAS